MLVPARRAPSLAEAVHAFQRRLAVAVLFGLFAALVTGKVLASNLAA